MKLVIVLALVLCACGTPENLNDYALIHKSGTACPSGWKLLPGKFTERNGSHEDGCENPSQDVKFSIDVLKAGESVSFTLGGIDAK